MYAKHTWLFLVVTNFTHMVKHLNTNTNVNTNTSAAASMVHASGICHRPGHCLVDKYGEELVSPFSGNARLLAQFAEDLRPCREASESLSNNGYQLVK